MPDILQQGNVALIQRRPDGHSQGGKDAPQPRAQAPRRVAESYQEVANAKPVDDRITILGIPVEQITPVTQAALAGLVAEINHLRNVVRRHERAVEKRSPGQPQPSDTQVLEPEAFLRLAGATLNQPPGQGNTWVVTLVHVSTYEDIRRSSGLLAANSALSDVAHRLREVQLSAGQGGVEAETVPSMPVGFSLLGYVGGSNLAALAAMPQDDFDAPAISRTIGQHLAGGYVVGGIDMALAINVAAAAVGSGESPLLALGRADHLLRSS